MKTVNDMNIEGLDYNTDREKIVLPEYGREIQKMVEHAMTLPTRKERQRCAETIVNVMAGMYPQMSQNIGFKQKLWDNIALMSGFKLDIDYPYDITPAKKISEKPEPMPYPGTDIKVKHYGKMMFALFDKLKTMPDGPERDRLIKLTADLMKEDLEEWSHGSMDKEKVADDLARFTDGKVQIDPYTFEFSKPAAKKTQQNNGGKKKKKK